MRPSSAEPPPLHLRLAALRLDAARGALRQNPRFSSGMSSPVYNLFRAMLTETRARNEGAVFLDNDIRKRLLVGVFDAYYHEAAPEAVIFDTNRGWTTKLPTLAELFPNAKMICCVRNPAWILDSIESLIRRNAFELSGIFSYDSGGTVYSRIEGLASAAGMYGFAFKAPKEAVYGRQSDRLLLVRYESLVSNSRGTLAAIYNFLGEDLFPHDPKTIEPCYDMIEFDQRLGTPGLHDVGRSVEARERKTILPPDLFLRTQKDAFAIPTTGLFRINYRMHLPAADAKDPTRLGRYLPPIRKMG